MRNFSSKWVWLLPFTALPLMLLSVPWVGYAHLIWIAFVPMYIFLSDTRVSAWKAILVSSLVLYAFILCSAYPFMQTEGTWWNGTHQLNKLMNENAQYSLGVILVATVRLLCFIPLLLIIRKSLRTSFGTFIVAFCWALYEWVYTSFGLWGYSGAVVGYSLVDTPYIKYLSQIGGVYTLSFLAILINATFSNVLLALPHGWRHVFNRVIALPAFVMVLMGTLYFSICVTDHPSGNIHEYQVAVIGGSFSDKKSISAYSYLWYKERLIEVLSSGNMSIVLLPENAFPYFELNEEDGSLASHTRITIPDRDQYYGDFLELSRKYSTTTIAVGVHTNRNHQHFNAIALFRNGTPVGYYEKRALVPFTEYAPFGIAIPILTPITQGAHNQQFDIAGVPASGLICSEIGVTGLPVTKHGVILSPSNDSVFVGNHATVMHDNIATLRAIEANAYVLRANSGALSSIISPNGEVLATTSHGVATATISILR